MTFLTPLFLLGLAALAVPVLIHLTQRERRQIVEFPSLMFLRKIPYESVKRRRIRDWLLLALRAAALALLVAAFARPFVRGSELSAAAGGPREVVLLLDRSYSMGAGDTWARAQQAARDVLGSVGPLDRVSLVLFSSSAELVLRSSADASRVSAEIDRAEPSAGSTRYAPALKLAASLLAESSLPSREAVLVSDFQRAGWQPDEAFRLPAGSAFTPVLVETSPARNLSVTPLSIERVSAENQERVVVTAGVSNRGSTPADVQMTLEVDGRAAQTARVQVAPASAAATTFPAVTLTAAPLRITTRIPEDALAADNAFHAVVRPSEVLPVALVGAGGRGDSDLYLTRALSIGDRPRFQVTTHQAEGLAPEALARTRVVILQDLPLADATSARLRSFVEGGGGLVVALGPRTSLPPDADWVPVVVGGLDDRTRGAAAKLSGFDYGHPVFEPFRAPRSGDFSTTRIYGFRRVTARPGAVTLARFDGGTPALVEGVFGRGRVLVWATTLDLSWNDLALKPVYLPFVHQLVRRASGYAEQPGWLTVGQALDVGASTTGRVVLTPSGQRRPAGEAGQALEVTESGFYEVRNAREGQPLQVVAANVDLSESDPARVETSAVSLAVTGQPGRGEQGEVGLVVPDAVQEQAQRIWWYLLFAGILLLIGESWLARRLTPVRR
ncbi:MAG: BatA domain-containing protein [Acidobacteria bacterium]|nr:BatA domain-containing protein [Acidobacteriota bacterium]